MEEKLAVICLGFANNVDDDEEDDEEDEVGSASTDSVVVSYRIFSSS